MSRYTTELRFIVENFAGLDKSIGYGTALFPAALETARPKIFNFDYPIYDTSYKRVLETKIIKHFYTREIGFETVGLFLLKLDTKMNEIMPFYNQLYKSAMLEFNPLYDIDLTTTHSGSGKNNTVSHSDNSGSSSANGTTTTTANNTSWDLYSDTPQGRLSGVEENNYLTDARKKTDINSGSTTATTTGTTTGTDDTTTDVNSTDSYINHVTGKTGGGSFSKMLLEFRDTMINIDLQIINELNDLFFNLY